MRVPREGPLHALQGTGGLGVGGGKVAGMGVARSTCMSSPRAMAPRYVAMSADMCHPIWKPCNQCLVGAGGDTGKIQHARSSPQQVLSPPARPAQPGSPELHRGRKGPGHRQSCNSDSRALDPHPMGPPTPCQTWASHSLLLGLSFQRGKVSKEEEKSFGSSGSKETQG